MENITCQLSARIVSVPMHTPCAHLFDCDAITSWLRLNTICPVCERNISLNDIVYNPIVARMRDQHYEQLNRSPLPSICSDDDEFLSPPTPPIRMDVPPRILYLNAPFLIASDFECGAVDLNAEQLTYLGRDRMVDLNYSLFNLASTNIQLEPVVDRLNQRFVNSYNVPEYKHVYAVIRKYVYQHRDSSPVAVARHLMLQGYFVYDLFEISNKNGLYNYCLYSLDVMSSGIPNILNRFIKFSNRLQ
jgi:hypothetical protein